MTAVGLEPAPAATRLISIKQSTFRDLNLGVSEERFQELSTGIAAIQERLSALSAEKNVPLAVLQQILSGFGEQGIALDPVQIEQHLRAKADEYTELRERLSHLTSGDPRVQELRREAAALIGDGAFETADGKLSEAENIDLKAIEEQEFITERRRPSAAGSRAARGDAARLRFDYRTAAAHFAAAASMVVRSDMDTWGFRLRQASALYDQGLDFGDNAALGEAIAVYGEALGLVPRERVPLDWATTQYNLGNALSTLGARENDTARLEEAVAAYDAALAVFIVAGADHYIEVCQANKNRLTMLL